MNVEVARNDSLLIANVSFDGAVDQMERLASANSPQLAVTMNMQLLRTASHSPEFLAACQSAAIRFADGRPVLWAASIAGNPLVERVAGADLEPAVCARLQRLGGQVLYIGGRPEVNAAAVMNRRKEFPDLEISGVSPSYGYERIPDEGTGLIDFINNAARRSGPLAVMLCTGSPKSELWAVSNIGRIERGVILTAGAAVDFAAGAKRRAGERTQRSGLEWLARFSQEPGRLGPRYARDAIYLSGLLARSAVARFSADGPQPLPDSR